ncbi:ArsR family transcriptional regulator [Oxalobacteraceae bacterium]|nr:ArsR family transcriptional regulator [Oxalobacteraceae bacterium]
MAQLLEVLVCLARIESERPGKPCSLAKLSKQSARPMSILRRQLTTLADAAWVVVTMDEQGGGSAALTPAGAALIAHV